MAEVITAARHHLHFSFCTFLFQVFRFQTVQNHIVCMRCVPTVQIRRTDIILAVVFEHTVAFTAVPLEYLVRLSDFYFAFCILPDFRQEDSVSSSAVRIQQIIFSCIFICKYRLVAGIGCSTCIGCHIYSLVPLKLAGRTV